VGIAGILVILLEKEQSRICKLGRVGIFENPIFLQTSSFKPEISGIFERT
jgi:hypothetical protein